MILIPLRDFKIAKYRMFAAAAAKNETGFK